MHKKLLLECFFQGVFAIRVRYLEVGRVNKKIVLGVGVLLLFSAALWGWEGPPVADPSPGSWYSAWDCPYQCHGDADCNVQGLIEYRVSMADLNILLNVWSTQVYDASADFDRDWDVDGDDEAILVNWYMVVDVPPNCPGQHFIYVDDDANGANDGSSWTNAYTDLQDALSAATGRDTILVAQGIYMPTQGTSRTATFQLVNGVAIRGGYAGYGAPDPNARFINTYETILSGDLAGNDVEVMHPSDLLNDPFRAENCYHVVTATGTDRTAVLDGVTITAGTANYYNSPTHIHSRGAGVLTGDGWAGGNDGSALLINCKITANSADYCGGGMYREGTPTLNNCTFSKNAAGHGGGILNHSPGSVTNCTFIDNWANDGGGFWNQDCPELTNCTFIGNSAGVGGGIYSISGQILLNNCVFINNLAGGGGGGLHCGENFWTKLTNCTFVGNSAGSGGGIKFVRSIATLSNCTFVCNSAMGGNALSIVQGSIILTNSILWDGGNEISGGSGACIVTYCDIQGGYTGLGNINVDPCFVSPGYWVDTNDPNMVVEPNDPNAVWVDGDYHLRSQGWYWHAGRKVWTWDEEVTSRCIDAGNPGSPLGNELLTIPSDPNHIWSQNLRINMGAYGGTAEASMPPYDWALLADLTNDGIVDYLDLDAQVEDWLISANEQPGDLNRDGTVDMIDYAILANDWLEQTTWY